MNIQTHKKLISCNNQLTLNIEIHYATTKKKLSTPLINKQGRNGLLQTGLANKKQTENLILLV